MPPNGFVNLHGLGHEQLPASLGAQTSANSLGVVLATDQPPIPTTSPNGTVSLNFFNDYASVSVTNGAWVTLVAATSANIKKLLIADTSGSIMRLAIGAAGFEVELIKVCRGGWAVPVEVFIAAGTRLSIQCQSTALVNAGDIIILGLT